MHKLIIVTLHTLCLNLKPEVKHSGRFHVLSPLKPGVYSEIRSFYYVRHKARCDRNVPFFTKRLFNELCPVQVKVFFTVWRKITSEVCQKFC